MAQPDTGLDRRPDPDALLALAGQEGKGRLRVFLGAAPGVGKTYAMLARARAAKALGHDIVIGVVETHGRSETEALIEGLEVLPRRRIDYRGRTLQEFDLDAALARKPQTILIDELAHTNAPDSRHPKRWQDVEELLGAGVDVWTTLNIQHLESLADVVTRITGVAVRETVPDRLLADAHDVILVDITPDELLERLSQGKVYVGDMAARARQNFFVPRNLIALRELALRRTAERVDDEMVDLLRQGAIEGPWATSERLLVLVGPESSGERLVRTAARLASGLNASWFALYIERTVGEEVSVEGVRNIDRTLRLAEALGAEVERRVADDMVGEALQIARRENITQILVGRSRATFPTRLWRPSLAAELVRRSTNIAVLVQIDEEPAPRPQRKKIEEKEIQLGVAAAVGLVAMTVGVGMLLERWLQPANFVTIFLLPVLICAARFGLWPAIATALLSFLAEDFFFLEPRYSFSISYPHEFITLIVSLLVAVVTGMLASRLRDHSRAMRQRAQSAQSLFEFSRKVSAARDLDEVLWIAATDAPKTLGIKSIAFLIPEERELAMRAAWPPIDRLDPGETVAARWALDKREAAGWRTGTLPNLRFQFRPLLTSRGVVAVTGVEPRRPDEPFDAQEERTLTAILDQAAIAIDRSLLVKESVRSAALEENEKLRTTLLASLSHDLRTPLASITGAVTSLQQLGDKMGEADRADLLNSIEEEAGRLARFVTNLLEMSRIESGALHPRRDLVDVAEVVRATLARCRKALPAARPTTVSLAPNLPPIRGDANLLGQVLFNLLDNAQKYGADGNVSVHGRSEGDSLVLTVTDEGPGIKPTDLERIFEKFWRGGRPDGRRAGTGLGLSICKGLVEAMGGTIVAQSPAIKKRGTRMILRFPISAATEDRK